MSVAIELMERGWLPDSVVRWGIRRKNRDRLQKEGAGSEVQQLLRKERFIDQMKVKPVAVHTDKANEQHYEVPPAFFQKVLGPHLKYSCCLWPEGVSSLVEAERASLNQLVERAQIPVSYTHLRAHET